MRSLPNINKERLTNNVTPRICNLFMFLQERVFDVVAATYMEAFKYVLVFSLSEDGKLLNH